MLSQFKSFAVAAAAAYAVSGAAVIGHHVPDSNWGTRGAVVDGAGAAAFALTALALAGLGPLLATGRLGRWSCRVAQLGLAGMTVESVASLVHGGNTLGPVFVSGLGMTLVGLLAFALAGPRSGGPRWAAPLPVLGLLVGIAGGDHGGFIGTAVVWLVLAAVTTQRSSRLIIGASRAG